MYYVYVIKSCKRKYRYVGISADPDHRIEQHNKGFNKTTKPYAPFNNILIEECQDRASAREKEKYYKSGVGREYLDKI